MNSKQKFHRYLELKGKITNKYNGYDLAKIVAVDLVSIVFFKQKRNFKMLRFVLASIDFSCFEKLNPTFVLATMGRYNRRKDYYEILDFVVSSAKIKSVIDLQYCPYKVKINFSNIFSSLVEVFSIFSSDLSLWDKLFLFQRITFYKNVIDDLEKYNLDKFCAKFLAFSSVHDVECILTQYFQQRNIPTYSLQHGLYFVFKDLISIDAVAYENFVSDFHLTWGQYSKEELQSFGVPAHKLLVGGYPRDVKFVKKDISKLKINKCVVFLARKQYEHSNLSLLTILKEFSRQNSDVIFKLKLHPSLSIDYYENLVSNSELVLISSNLTLTQLLKSNEFDLSITVNTAAYYESYIYNVPSLRYFDGTFENSISIDNDVFDSMDELQGQFFRLNAIEDNNAYFNLINERLQYSIGLDINNYNYYLNDI